MSILRWLGLEPKTDVHAGASQSLDRITRALDRMDPQRARYVAAFAFILSRVANADLDISADERREMERLVTEFAGLDAEHAALVVELARNQEHLFGGTENFLATREFRDMASPTEKEALLHCLFAVSAADETISSAEEEEIRQIARELLLSHEDYIAIRSTYSARRAVFQKGLRGE